MIILFMFFTVSWCLPYVDKNMNFIDFSYVTPEIYGTPVLDGGNALSSAEAEEHPEELGEYVEGDMLVPLSSRNGLMDRSKRWHKGVIPYVIDGKFSDDQRDLILKSISDYHRLTCLRFVPRGSQKDYLFFTGKSSGCWSSLGMIGGRQELNLQIPGCVRRKGTIIHEMLHAIGFFHEQSRPERDEYVDIIYENVQSGVESNFRKVDPETSHGYGVPYDYNSVMHYSGKAFSKNGQNTIEPKVPGVKIGQRKGLSRGDVKKINNLYNCNKEEPQNGWKGDIFMGSNI